MTQLKPKIVLEKLAEVLNLQKILQCQKSKLRLNGLENRFFLTAKLELSTSTFRSGLESSKKSLKVEKQHHSTEMIKNQILFEQNVTVAAKTEIRLSKLAKLMVMAKSLKKTSKRYPSVIFRETRRECCRVLG